MNHNLKLNNLSFDSLSGGDVSTSASDSIVYRYRDVPGIAQARRALGLSVANRLGDAAAALNSDVARREAFLIANCAASENSWFASSLHSENEATGLTELFDGVGVLAGCGSRLCPACSGDLRRRSRKRARAGLKAAENAGGLRFVTLTQPTPRGASLVQVLKVFQDAWRRLNKKQFWMDRALGVVKGVEFTVNDLGYHVHAHLIVIGSYIERDKAQELKSVEWRQHKKDVAAGRGLRLVETEKLPTLGNLQDAWESCLRAAWSEAGWLVIDADDDPASAFAGGVFVDMRSASGGVGVDVRAVRSKKSKYGDADASDISTADALKEVLKYVTKSDSWLKLPDAHLVEVASVRRWSRMFELLGVCRPAAPSRASVANGSVAGVGSVDSAPSVPAVAQTEHIPFDARLAALREDAFSKFGDADAMALVRQAVEDRQSAPLLGVAPDTVAAVVAATAYLDTPYLSADTLEELNTISDPLAFALRRARSLHRSDSLRSLGAVVDFKAWCVLVRVRISKKIKVRKALLARQFPHATFWTLGGDKWALGQSFSGMRLAVS
jgi:hypothetical protein